MTHSLFNNTKLKRHGSQNHASNGSLPENENSICMKKTTLIITALLFSAVFLSAQIVPVNITLNKRNNTRLLIGESEQLTATISPENATSQNIIWWSNNPLVATVVDGLITGVSEGGTVVYAQIEGYSIRAAIDVNVRPFVHTTGVTLSESDMSLTFDLNRSPIGEQRALTATVEPANAENRKVTWHSSNPDVVFVGGDARLDYGYAQIAAVSPAGTARITARTEDGNFEAYCNVTVGKLMGARIVMNPTALLISGETQQLTATLQPAAANDYTSITTWTSSNPAVATVVDGKITAVSAGTATITAGAEGGRFESNCLVTVVAQTDILSNGCNTITPMWGESLGTVSFATNQEWTVGNQIWSDAVQTSVCSGRSPNIFEIGNPTNCFANCRSNPGQKGDFFSWCAVMRFGDILCPYPWRVPTKDDFLELVLALDGEETERFQNTTVRNRLLNDWGGNYAGYIYMGDIIRQTNTVYWTQSETNHSLFFCSGGWIDRQSYEVPHNMSAALRCVRDNIPTSVNTISSEKEKTIIGYFNILGQKLPQKPTSGLFIILYDNGKSEKRR